MKLLFEQSIVTDSRFNLRATSADGKNVLGIFLIVAV